VVLAHINPHAAARPRPQILRNQSFMGLAVSHYVPSRPHLHASLPESHRRTCWEHPVLATNQYEVLARRASTYELHWSDTLRVRGGLPSLGLLPKLQAVPTGWTGNRVATPLYL
jgi:hypothetical protein